MSPLPPARLDLCVRFEHMADGVAACRKIAQEDLDPTMMRLYDRDDAGIFLRNHPDEPRDPYMILSFEGFDALAAAGHTSELASMVGLIWLLAEAESLREELQGLMSQALGDAGIDAPLWCLTRGAVTTGPAGPWLT